MRPLFAVFAFGALLITVAGCCSTTYCAPTAVPVVADGPPTTAKVQDPDDVKYYRSDEPLRMGIEHFNRGNFRSEQYFATHCGLPMIPPPGSVRGAYDRLAP